MGLSSLFSTHRKTNSQARCECLHLIKIDSQACIVIGWNHSPRASELIFAMRAKGPPELHKVVLDDFRNHCSAYTKCINDLHLLFHFSNEITRTRIWPTQSTVPGKTTYFEEWESLKCTQPDGLLELKKLPPRWWKYNKKLQKNELMSGAIYFISRLFTLSGELHIRLNNNLAAIFETKLMCKWCTLFLSARFTQFRQECTENVRYLCALNSHFCGVSLVHYASSSFIDITRVKTHKLLQVCKQVVTSLFSSCQQVVFAQFVVTSLEQVVNNL